MTLNENDIDDMQVRFSVSARRDRATRGIERGNAERRLRMIIISVDRRCEYLANI